MSARHLFSFWYSVSVLNCKFNSSWKFMGWNVVMSAVKLQHSWCWLQNFNWICVKFTCYLLSITLSFWDLIDNDKFVPSTLLFETKCTGFCEMKSTPSIHDNLSQYTQCQS
jgi:hypothetical protein